MHVEHSNGVMHHTVRACVKQVQRSQRVWPCCPRAAADKSGPAFAHFTETSRAERRERRLYIKSHHYYPTNAKCESLNDSTLSRRRVSNSRQI